MNKFLGKVDWTQLCITLVVNIVVWAALSSYNTHRNISAGPKSSVAHEEAMHDAVLVRAPRFASALGNGNGNSGNNNRNGNDGNNSGNGNNGNGNNGDHHENGNSGDLHGNGNIGNRNGNNNGNHNGNINDDRSGITKYSRQQIRDKLHRKVNRNVNDGNINGNINHGNINGNSNGPSNKLDRGATFNGNGNIGGGASVQPAVELFTSFVLWGMTSCPGITNHMGILTTGSAQVTGSETGLGSMASDMMCLPDIYETRDDVVNLDRSIASTIHPVFRSLNKNSKFASLKCAFCSANVNHVRTLIGTTECPRGWEKYHSGYLMTKRKTSVPFASYMTGNYCVKSAIATTGASTLTSSQFALSFILVSDEPLSCAVCAK